MNYQLLTIYADLVDDLEKSRIATENRIRSLREIKGLAGSPEEERLDAIAMGLAQAEHQAVNELRKAMKLHPLGEWVVGQVGIGEKQAGRLLGALGDPSLRVDPETGEAVERTRNQLWAYCGFAPGQKRQKGVKANWNALIKMRAYLIAESCMKQRTSPYRPVYERAKEAWAGRDTSDLHKHNHALRIVAKSILNDLWAEARRVRGVAQTGATSERKGS